MESLKERHARNTESNAKLFEEIETIRLQRQEYRSRVKDFATINEQLRAEIEYKTSVLTQTEADLRKLTKRWLNGN